MTTMDFRVEHRQQQTLSPRLQHAVRLLQMSSLDFAQVVHEVLGRNPFLEDEALMSDGSNGTAAAPADETAGADAGLDERMATAGAADQALEMPAGAAGEDERESWQGDGSSRLRRADDGEMSAMEMLASEPSLQAELHAQVDLLPLDSRDRTLAKSVIESLDDDGYLRTPLDELARLVELDPPASLAELQIALRHVQALEPAGVAARDVAECLKLQLPLIECEATRQIAEVIVTEHLSALASRDINGLARALNRPVAEVEAVCERIRRLDPRPGWRCGASQVQYVVPDVIVKKIRGDWTVQLNPAIVPKVRLNESYAELFQRHRCSDHGELAAHLQEARWTLRNVEQRFATIVLVAQAIVRRQQHFLEFGPMAMKPLGLREIADEVGLHESTVSRVTNNKFMTTPLGVFELKYFFSRALVCPSGHACSGTAIRGLIKDMITAESSHDPLSDAEIARQLARQGLKVARRTVTKYRQLLRIDAVERRRKHA
ncbi:RNA polymerase factor sigma-54 [Aquincola sp. S2]|uniref:RNA polymerase sigma-54 factor n=1 Tax=Pseudaquabacterium terrae TaxID=2732868 RepID=A0ABX2EHW7_9BURK|nr:RNA polymerase factor sigma-54 [Aquabacterium terrae]NRF68171.1 RNA polymerase factor sigma-54 [Aquabacterium terrae]